MIDVNEYIGTPYTELNCWGLVQKFYADNLNTIIRAEPTDKAERMHWTPINPGTESIHDLLVFRIRENKRHVGICLGRGKMIHSDELAGVVIENYNSVIWKDRLQIIYRRI